MLVLARPCLDGVDVGGLAVEDVGPDRRDEGQEQGRQNGAESECGAESVFLLHLDVVLAISNFTRL